MAAIRSLDQIAQKWGRVASASGASYEDGVKNPTASWSAGAAAANDAWKSGVQAAVASNRFAGGVRAAGDQKWQQNTVNKGPARFAQGVQLATPDYSAGFAPYRDAIQAASLPPRGARRSPQNLQRVTAIVNALAAKKEAMMKAGG